MAAPQIGFSLSRTQRSVGTKWFTIDPTGVTGFSTTATFVHTLDVTKPLSASMGDILQRLQIYPAAYVTAATNKPKIKVLIDSVTGDGVADDGVADMSKAPLDLGLQEGDTIKLADAP